MHRKKFINPQFPLFPEQPLNGCSFFRLKKPALLKNRIKMKLFK
ncbi:hypothetical protein N824_00595 [Pedobacter sp. V48]|nr:hypothetical protein N824_00595 [Pedobacter sp. V48]